VQVGAVFALGADGVAGELFAFALVAEVEGVGEFAGVAFFAEAALVVCEAVSVHGSSSRAMVMEVVGGGCELRLQIKCRRPLRSFGGT